MRFIHRIKHVIIDQTLNALQIIFINKGILIASLNNSSMTGDTDTG